MDSGEFTPTTEEVRARYSSDEFGYSDGLSDRQVKAEALRDFADSLDDDVIADMWAEPGSHTHLVVSNAITYVQVRALRDAEHLERRREETE